MINGTLFNSSRVLVSENLPVGSGLPTDKKLQNHVIDPTFFYDVIEEFSFDYTAFIIVRKELDDSGRDTITFGTQTIRGSLQSKGSSLHQSYDGNTTSMTYMFYCKSIYRLNIGDVIVYKGQYLMVESVQDYDEYGCRECSLTMIHLQTYRDLAAYVKYLEGEELV